MLAVGRRGDVPVGQLQQFFAAVSARTEQCIVHLEELAAAVIIERDADRRQLEEPTELAFAVLEREIGLLAGGDIQVRAGHAQRPALRRALDHGAARGDPDPVALAVAQAEIGFIDASRFSEARDEAFDDRLDVVRMQHRLPAVDGDEPELLQTVAEHAGPAVVDMDHAGLDVPFPRADAGALDDVA